MDLIEVIDYHKNYGETVAVSGLSFTVGGGEVLGLLGPNGAGKTTTLRTLAGIIRPTQGTIRAGGHDVVAQPVEAKKSLAYVPDDPKLFDALTVWEHLQFTASVYGVDDYTQAGEELLDQFELTAKRETLAQELSRGMRQKLAICCAYLHEPRAILLDEPMTGIDPLGIRTFKASVAERARSGAAVIISSHLLSLIEDLCTHLLIIHEGKALFSGSVEEARGRFADLKSDASLEEVFFRVTAE